MRWLAIPAMSLLLCAPGCRSHREAHAEMSEVTHTTDVAREHTASTSAADYLSMLESGSDSIVMVFAADSAKRDGTTVYRPSVRITQIKPVAKIVHTTHAESSAATAATVQHERTGSIAVQSLTTSKTAPAWPRLAGVAVMMGMAAISMFLLYRIIYRK